MRYLFGMACLAALVAFALLDCGDESSRGGEGGRGGGGGAGPEIASVFIYTYEFDPPPMMVRLEGVRVCELGTDNCDTSDARGLVQLDFPRDHREIAITTEKEGYAPRVYGNVTDEHFPDAGYDEHDPVGMSMFTHEEMATIAEQLGTAYPWEGGIVGLIRWPSPTPGVKFMPVGGTVDEVGEPFYYDDATQQYSLEIEATTKMFGFSEFPLAEGGFTEVTPGVQQFELAGAARDCPQASWAWPGDAPNRIRVPVLEGYITYGSMRCDPP